MNEPDKPESNKPPSNAERLGLHLNPQSLAASLLAAWVPSDPADKRRENLLAALSNYNAENRQDDGASATDQD